MQPKKRNATSWQPGQSGNPSGRKPGSGKVARLRESVAAHVPEILTRMAELAKSGDVQAARLLLERVVPPVRPESLPQPVDLPERGGLGEQGQAVLAAISSGQLGVHEGASLLSAIGAHARAVEVHELMRRIEALERAANAARPR